MSSVSEYKRKLPPRSPNVVRIKFTAPTKEGWVYRSNARILWQVAAGQVPEYRLGWPIISTCVLTSSIQRQSTSRISRFAKSIANRSQCCPLVHELWNIKWTANWLTCYCCLETDLICGYANYIANYYADKIITNSIVKNYDMHDYQNYAVQAMCFSLVLSSECGERLDWISAISASWRDY